MILTCVAASGGHIAVNSAPGLGTRIDVHLPLREAAGTAQAAAAAPAAGTSLRGRGEHVLLADDDDVVGLTLQALLERAGYRVTRVDSGIAAIDAVRLAPRGHDLVVTDFNMPGLSGLSVAEQIAAIAPGLPVVITSGYVTEELLDRAGVSQRAETGADEQGRPEQAFCRPVEVETRHVYSTLERGTRISRLPFDCIAETRPLCSICSSSRAG